MFPEPAWGFPVAVSPVRPASAVAVGVAVADGVGDAVEPVMSGTTVLRLCLRFVTKARASSRLPTWWPLFTMVSAGSGRSVTAIAGCAGSSTQCRESPTKLPPTFSKIATFWLSTPT